MSDTAPFEARSRPIVGRDDELRRVAGLIDAASGGRGCLLLISGEAGIGKSALVRELAARAGLGGFRVLRGHCYDLTLTPPYGPWLEALAGALDEQDAAAEPAGVSRGNPFVGLEAAVRNVAAEQPLLIVLEDLHWSDDASLALLRHLSHRVEDAPLILAATYRDDELSRDALLFRLLPRLVREAPATRFELRRLGEENIRDFVRSRYHLPAVEEQRLVALLARYTDGIPLFVEELLRTLERDGRLARQAAGWSFPESGDSRRRPPVPELLLQILEDRLASLDDTTREALRGAAALGEEVPFDLWHEVLDLPDDAASTVVESALGHRVLEETPGGSLRFRHALVRETLYNELIPPRRREWHGRVAGALLKRPAPDPDLVSFHLQQAGDPRAAGWLIRAAERAARTYAPIAATERLKAALELLDAEGLKPSELGWYLLKLGSMAREHMSLEEAGAHLDRALEIALDNGDAVLEANVIWARGTNRCYHGLNGLDDMEQALERGRQLDLDARTREPLRLLQGESISAGVFATWCALFGDFARALRAAVEELSLDPARTFQRQFGAAFAHGGRAYAFALLGRPGEARREFQALQASFDALQHAWAQGIHYFGELITLAVPYFTDDLQYRRFLAGQIDRRWRDHSARATLLPPRYGLVPNLLLEGRWDDVRELTSHLTRASAYEFYGIYALGVVARFQGQSGLAWRQVELGIPEGSGAAAGGMLRLETLLLQGLAVELALDSDNLALARAWLAAQERWLGPAGEAASQRLVRSDHHLLRARVLARSGDPAAARVEAARSLAEASTPRQPLALLRAQRFLGRLSREAGDVDAARACLVESARLASACEIPHEQAQTWLAQARLEAEAGDRELARSLLDQAGEVVKRLDLALLRPEFERINRRLSGRSEASPSMVPLTPRELEVVRHIVEGLSNREIAANLSLSVRTVERHISNIYNKTGVQGRAAITVYALRHGIH